MLRIVFINRSRRAAALGGVNTVFDEAWFAAREKRELCLALRQLTIFHLIASLPGSSSHWYRQHPKHTRS